MSKFFSNLSVMLGIRGVAAILFGVVALVWPDITLEALILVFGAFVLVDGVAALIAAITNSTPAIPRWVLALDGVAGVITGLIALILPGITSLALLYLIASWSLLSGGLLIGAAVAGPRFEPGWLMALDGVISIAFGVVLVAFPGSGILAIVWTLGLFSLISGITTLVAAVRLHKDTDEVKASIDKRLGRSAA